MRSISRTPFPAVAIAVALALAAGAGAQPADVGGQGASELPASFDASIAVDLVTVEVVVVDERGRPLYDLEREEFELFEDGQPVDVKYFEPPVPGDGDVPTAAVSSAESGTSAVTATPADPPAHVIVFVDNLHIGVANREQVFATLRETLKESLRSGDEVMLVSYDGGVAVDMPFTSSRRDLAEALEMHSRTEARYLIAAMEDRRAMERIQQTAEVESGSAKNPEMGLCVSLGQFAWEHAWDRRSETLQTIDSLRAFVGTLAGVPGRKTLIHVSDGLPLTPGAAIVQYAIDFCDGTAVQEGISHAMDITAGDSTIRGRYWDPSSSRIEMSALDLSTEWYRLASEASTHRVTFYPLQVSGATGFATDIAGQVRATARTETLARNDPRDTLVLLARETGGRAVLDANDFGPALASALADARNAYVLGFSPAAGGEGNRHGLRVEVTRPDTRVRHPQSYYRKSPHEQVADAVVSSLIHGVESNPMGLALAMQERSGESAAALRVSMPLAGTTLVPMGDRAEGHLTFFVVVRRADGTISEVRRRTIPVRVPAEAAKTGLPFVFDLGMGLAPGEHQVAVGVYDEIGGSLSYLRRDVQVAGATGGGR